MSFTKCGDMMIFLQWFQFLTAVSKFVPLRFVSFSEKFLQSCCWSTSSPRAVGLPEQDCWLLRHDASHDLPDEDAIVS